jgi:16S rRNA (adenine1518-N6/adenine1519-N6)-dimethyltransferase
VNLSRYAEPRVKVQDEKRLFEMVRTAFNQRRKTLSNSLSNNPALGVSRQEVADALLKMGVDEKARGEILTLEQFAELSDILQR